MLHCLKNYALHILIIFHLVGLVGIIFIDKETFAALTPLNLLLSAFLVILCHQGNQKKLTVLLLSTFILGYLVELIGTQTGFPFGDYRYGESLGVKLFGVPVIIGVNWFLMVMGTGFLGRRATTNSKLQTLLAAALMVLIDLAIEPIAPALGYWFWADGDAPLLNYLGWFVVAVVMQVIFQKTLATHTNKLAVPYILILSVFFVILNFAL